MYIATTAPRITSDALYTTPVIYLLVDRLRRRYKRCATSLHPNCSL
jgi:hypothetical protein